MTHAADLPHGYRWATADETEAHLREPIPGMIVVSRATDSTGKLYTHGEADLALPDEPALLITVTRSAGDDRAVLVLIDTTFEPDGSDGSPGLRVLINDDQAYVGKWYDLGANHEAGVRHLRVPLSEIDYTGRENS